MRTAAAQCSRFVAAAAAGETPYWLTLAGVTGCGKTMLAEQTFREARRHNPADRVTVWQSGVGVWSEYNRRPVSLWMTATTFAERVRADFHYTERLANEYLVAIDDIGAARDQTTFIAEALYRLLNARIGRWTLMTTNFSLSEIGTAMDERVSSRMIRDRNQFCVIRAGDYAMRKTR